MIAFSKNKVTNLPIANDTNSLIIPKAVLDLSEKTQVLFVIYAKATAIHHETLFDAISPIPKEYTQKQCEEALWEILDKWFRR